MAPKLLTENKYKLNQTNKFILYSDIKLNKMTKVK